MTVSGMSARPATVDFRRHAAAKIEHHFGRQIETGKHESRIDATLEPITGIGIDAELAAGPGDVDLVPQRRLDEHVGRGFRAAGFFAAHDAGEQLDALVISDDATASSSV